MTMPCRFCKWIFLLRLCLASRWVAFLQRLKMTRVCRHYKMTKCVFFVRHCEPFSQKRRGNPKIRLEFCPKFKAKIKKDEMLWIQSQILQKCSQTLARPALYRHSFHREFGFSDTKPTWRGLQGLELFVVWVFIKISNCHFKPFLKSKQMACKHKSKQKSILSFWAFCKKAKNPKKFKTYFKFVDTSLCSVWQGSSVWQNLGLWLDLASPCHCVPLKWLEMAKFRHCAKCKRWMLG